MNVELLLLVVFVGAFFAPLFARTLGMPVPVGELVFGLILGYMIGGSSHIPDVISFLAEFGFLLLMFLAGLEIDFNLLERIEGRLLTVYTVYTFLIFLTSIGIAYIFGFSIPSLLIISLVSVGLMVATLRDMSILSSTFAKKVMIIGIIGELMSLFFLTLMEKIGRFTAWKNFLLEVGVIVLFFVVFFVVFYMIKLLLWWFPEILKRLTYEEDPSAIGIRLSLALMFTTAVLAHLAGMESVLGAFLAGVVFSYFIRKKHDLEEKLSSIGYGFLIPIFFIKTGMSMEFEGVSMEILENTFTLLALMLAVRYIPSALLLLGSHTVKEVVLSPLLLAYPFTLMIAGIEIAHSAGLIDKKDVLSLFISAVLSSLLFPWMSKLLVWVLR